MKKHTLARLNALSTEVLADALYELTKQSDEAKSVVDRLIQTSDEAYKSTKRVISALSRSTKYIDWTDINGFVRKLENIVQDIDEIDINDEQRFDLICRFFETDDATFSRVDDSSGTVQDVYLNSATTVFNQCASHLASVNQALVARKWSSCLSPMSTEYVTPCLMK